MDAVSVLKNENSMVEFINGHYFSNCDESVSDYINSLLEIKKALNDEFDSIMSCKRLLEERNISISRRDLSLYTSYLVRLMNDTDYCIELANKLLSEKQKKCVHALREIYYDSHYVYYKCDKCGLNVRY